MVDLQKDLSEGPDLPALVARVGLPALLFPAHPRYPGRNLKVGIDEKGDWWTFEPIECKGPGGWRKYRPCRDRRVALLLLLDDAEKLAHEEGAPPGCHFVSFLNT